MSDKPTHSLYRGVIYITSAVTRAFQRCIIQYILLLNYIIYGRGGVLLLLWPRLPELYCIFWQEGLQLYGTTLGTVF
jgi:hypothetical protein